MFSQQILSQLNVINANIVYQDENENIIVQSPVREGWEWLNKNFSVYTRVFTNYSDYINDMMWMMWQKVKLEYIDDEAYKDIKFSNSLI